MIKKAVIPAAGFGTRMLPASKVIPKEMLPIYDKPTIQYIVEEAVKAGIEEILIIVSKGKDSIADHFDTSFELEYELNSKNSPFFQEVQNVSNMVNIHFVRQKERKGLGHAIYCAKTFVGNDPFAVLLGDDVVFSETPCIKQLIDEYDRTQSTILGVQQVAMEDVSKYGIVDGRKIGDRIYKADKLVEKPSIEEATTNVAILGRYVITPDIFDILEHTKRGKGGEIQLTDALNTLAQKKDMYAYEFQGRRYDVGNKQGMLEASVEYALRDDETREGVIAYLKGLEEKNYNI